MKSATQLVRDLGKRLDSNSEMQSMTSGQRESKLSAQAVSHLFKTFSRLFGHKWTATNEDEAAKTVWLRALELQGVTDQTIKIGLAKCASEKWPPNPAEFAELCRPTPEDFGMPDEHAAYVAACRAVHDAAFSVEPKWPHPAVFHAAHDVGAYDIRTKPEKETRKRFMEAYAKRVKQVMSGEHLDMPERKLLENNPHNPVSADAVKERLAQARAALRGEA